MMSHKIQFCILLASTSFAGGLLAQPENLYENYGFVDQGSELPINARAFANYGSFTVFGALPFDTQNTLNFTNTGVMNGSVGFRFDQVADNGKRSKAEHFYNASGAEINSSSLFFEDDPSFLMVSATNVVNKGLLTVGVSGLLSIDGGDVDLSDSAIGVSALRGSGSYNSMLPGDPPTPVYFPDTGITDEYWGGMTNVNRMDTVGLLNVLGESANITSPIHMVTNAAGFIGNTLLSLQSANSYVISNAVTETNIIVQAVFSSVADPRILTDVTFSDSPRTNEVKTANIRYQVPLTNYVTASDDLFTLYLSDTLAWDTNLVFAPNQNAATVRPYTYTLSRLDTIGFNLGSPSNSVVSPSLLWNDTFSNTFVTNFYAAYSANVASVIDNSGSSINTEATNSLSGRVTIKADSLNLDNTRLRSEGFLSINANHLESSSNAIIDSQNVSYGLASMGSVLNVNSVVTDEIDRLQGNIAAYSAIWTNLSGIVITNPPENEESEETFTTNVVEYLYHVLIVDATDLSTTVPVFVHDFAAEGDKVNIDDDMNVVRSLLIDSQNVVNNGEITVFSNIQNLGTTNFPSLKSLLNNGTISVNESLQIGTDTTNVIDSIVNSGQINAFFQRYQSQYFENSGRFDAGGRIDITAVDAKLDNGTISSGRDIVINAENVKLQNAELISSTDIRIGVSGVLTDGGFPNTFAVNNGFTLAVKPASGDLLGSTFNSTLPRFAAVNHLWAGEDRGNSPSGFHNNAAIGRLILDGRGGSRARFNGVGNNNAIYVDSLEFAGSLLDTWKQNVSIADNFTVYYASSNIPVEELSSHFGARMQWVSEFVGDNSSLPIVLSDGTSILVNKLLRESLTIDSDGDGAANGIDPTPFDGVILANVEIDEINRPQAVISWIAAGATNYRVEFKDALSDPNWTYLKSVQNNANDRQEISVSDSLTGDNQGRFYRVTYQP